MKAEVCQLDINELVPVPVDLSKVSDVVKDEFVKKTLYAKLIAKVNSIDTRKFALKIMYDTDISEIENKIPDNRLQCQNH